MAMRAPRAASVSPWLLPAPAPPNMVTGIATAMLDSSPVVCITGQVSSKVLGSDAFQEVDITGITMPITKIHVVVSRAEDIARTLREAFIIAQSGRPGPVLVDFTKDAHRLPPNSIGTRALRSCRSSASAITTNRTNLTAPSSCSTPPSARDSRRPRHHALRGHAPSSRNLYAPANIPVAMTLLGIGLLSGQRSDEPGMMGMHGEAWVNTAIQEADLLIAVGMRFDDRVTGDLRTYARNARKIHIEVDRAEINKNVQVDAALVGDAGETLSRLLPHIHDGDHLRGWRISRSLRAIPPCAIFRACRTAAISTLRTLSTICGRSPGARPSWSPTSASTRCGKRSITTTTARAR